MWIGEHVHERWEALEVPAIFEYINMRGFNEGDLGNLKSSSFRSWILCVERNRQSKKKRYLCYCINKKNVNVGCVTLIVK